MNILIPIGAGFCLGQTLTLICGVSNRATPYLILFSTILVLVGHFGGLLRDLRKVKDIEDRIRRLGR